MSATIKITLHLGKDGNWDGTAELHGDGDCVFADVNGDEVFETPLGNVIDPRVRASSAAGMLASKAVGGAVDTGRPGFDALRRVLTWNRTAPRG